MSAPATGSARFASAVGSLRATLSTTPDFCIVHQSLPSVVHDTYKGSIAAFLILFSYAAEIQRVLAAQPGRAVILTA